MTSSIVFVTIPQYTTLEKSAISFGLMYVKTVLLNIPGIRSMNETQVREDPSDPLDREKTPKYNGLLCSRDGKSVFLSQIMDYHPAGKTVFDNFLAVFKGFSTVGNRSIRRHLAKKNTEGYSNEE
jgi:hypothetical protein